MCYLFLNECTYVQGDKPFKAYQQVIEERPLAAVQILLAIFAVEALGQFNQVSERERERERERGRERKREGVSE